MDNIGAQLKAEIGRVEAEIEERKKRVVALKAAIAALGGREPRVAQRVTKPRISRRRHKCAVCDKGYLARANSRYCGRKCGNLAYRQRRQAREEAQVKPRRAGPVDRASVILKGDPLKA